MRFALLLFFPVSLLVAQPLCSVSLRVVDPGGRPLDYRVTSFVEWRVSGATEWANEFVNMRGRVPCGSNYAFELTRADGAHRLSSTISTYQPEIWRTLLADAGSPRVPPRGYVWKGSIRPTHGQRLWVHIRSATDAQLAAEAEVDSSGDFRIYQVFTLGAHLLYVMNDYGDTVYSTTLKITNPTPWDELRLEISSLPVPIVEVK